MVRFLARALGTLLLAVALVYAVGDIARSIADDVVIATPFSAALEGLGLAQGAAAGYVAPVAALVGPFPAALVLFVAALLFLLLGRAPRRRAAWPQAN